MVATTTPPIAVGRVALHPLAHLAATTQALLALAVVATTAPALDQPLAVVLDRPPLVAALVALLVAVLEDADSRQLLV